jgi:hypothetical protein
MSNKSEMVVRWFTVAGFLLVTVSLLMQIMVSFRSSARQMQEETFVFPTSLRIMHHQADNNFTSLSNETNTVIQRNSSVPTTVSSDTTSTMVSSLVGNNSDNASFEDLRIAIFITTHMTEEHATFLRRCWSSAVENVSMLRQSDCILFTTEDPPVDLLPSTFEKFHAFQIHTYENPGYHEGALLAMSVAMDNDWFADYDWVLRVNADVVIRDDSFFRQVLVDPSVDAVFVKCGTAIQTDFFAFRPNTTAPGAFRRQKHDRPIAEPDTTLAFQETLQHTKRFKYLEGGRPNGGSCRVVGRDSPVIHDHDFLKQCPDLKTHHARNIW